MQTLTKIATVLLSFIAVGASYNHASAKTQLSKKTETDSSRIRDVQTSQQLFMVKLLSSSEKTKKSIKKKINFRYELRAVFRVIYMDMDTTYTVTDWIKAPDGECPEMRTYYYGTPDYNNLDKLIAKAKKNGLPLANLVTGAGVKNLILPQLDTLLKLSNDDRLKEQKQAGKVTTSKKNSRLELPKHINSVQRK